MEVPLFKLTREAGADLSALYLYAVKLNSSSQVVAISAATDVPYAILQNDSANAAGKAAELMMAGVSEVIAGAALTVGAQVTVDATGRIVAAVAGTDTTKYVIGIVMVGCANAGERATISFNCLNPGRAA